MKIITKCIPEFRSRFDTGMHAKTFDGRYKNDGMGIRGIERLLSIKKVVAK